MSSRFSKVLIIIFVTFTGVKYTVVSIERSIGNLSAQILGDLKKIVDNGDGAGNLARYRKAFLFLALANSNNCAATQALYDELHGNSQTLRNDPRFKKIVDEVCRAR